VPRWLRMRKASCVSPKASTALSLVESLTHLYTLLSINAVEDPSFHYTIDLQRCDASILQLDSLRRSRGGHLTCFRGGHGSGKSYALRDIIILCLFLEPNDHQTAKSEPPPLWNCTLGKFRKKLGRTQECSGTNSHAVDVVYLRSLVKGRVSGPVTRGLGTTSFQTCAIVGCRECRTTAKHAAAHTTHCRMYTGDVAPHIPSPPSTGGAVGGLRGFAHVMVERALME
jgi:hypothetical protein